jgi:hypothetical protein
MAVAERWRRWRAEREDAESLRGGHQSFWSYRRARWLKRAAALVLLASLLYAATDPWQGHSGGTWLGYGLGGLSLALVVWLAWLGVRKRQFDRGRGLLTAWVSAHVYLGLALVVIATLHSGFQFGWNVHTLAYVLMSLVVLSGIYGALAYTVMPRKITHNLAGMSREGLLRGIAEADEAALAAAARLDAETHAMTLRSAARAQVGGGWWQQLRGRYRRRQDSRALEAHVRQQAATLARTPAAPVSDDPFAGETIMFVAGQMFESGRAERGPQIDALLAALARRKTLVAQLNRDLTLRARQSIWLYLHVPLSLALLASLLVHVLTVFLYW